MEVLAEYESGKWEVEAREEDGNYKLEVVKGDDEKVKEFADKQSVLNGFYRQKGTIEGFCQ